MAEQIRRGEEQIRKQEERINKLNEKLNEIKEDNKNTIKELDRELEEKRSQIRNTEERLNRTMAAMDKYGNEAAMTEKIEELTKENKMFKDYLMDRELITDFENWAIDYKTLMETEQNEEAGREHHYMGIKL